MDRTVTRTAGKGRWEDRGPGQDHGQLWQSMLAKNGALDESYLLGIHRRWRALGKAARHPS